jgi:prepilin-type N-terminal cleavage/methylation domain-containing protein
MHRRSRKGFTLTEILVALAIFALGGTAIMALFITNIRLSRQAMDYTRAAEITRNVRSLMTQAVSRPILIREGDSIYQFYYPDTSLTFRPDQFVDSEGGTTGTGDVLDRNAFGGAAENSVFFRLPTEPFNAAANSGANDRMVTELPTDGLNETGSPKPFAQGNPRVFRFKPDMLRRAGAIDGALDEDDRIAYQFDLQVRRSVLRSGVDDTTSGAGGKQALEDLYVVHIKIYRGFEFEGDVRNDPFFEWDFYVTATR